MNIISVLKDKCTGCMECVSICPLKCISITDDEEGFKVPKVNNSICIQCGKCYQKCPTVNKVIKSKPIEVYAVQGKNKEEVSKSASGGITYLISKKVINSGGIVYGCIYDDALRAVHKRATTLKELELQRGSKYVQSDFSEIFPQLLKDCKTGREVVVIGTPCQIGAVRNYLGKDYSNLILIDLICHGVPSPKLFKQYINWKEFKMGGQPILKYNFRDKSNGWGTVNKVETAILTSILSATEDPYYSAFIYGETYRECCYQCEYACEERVGDITVGDFWGIQREHPEMCDNVFYGVSCLLINTDKGKSVLSNIVNEIEYVKSSLAKVSVENSNLYKPAKRPDVRNDFYIKCFKSDFKWANHRMYKKVRFYINWIKERIPKTIKSQIKNMIGR